MADQSTVVMLFPMPNDLIEKVFQIDHLADSQQIQEPLVVDVFQVNCDTQRGLPGEEVGCVQGSG